MQKIRKIKEHGQSESTEITVRKIMFDKNCVPIERLHHSKAAFEDRHSVTTKTVPFQRFLKM